MITGTKQQEAIWHELANGTGDVTVNAGAGTGKTFTIVVAAEQKETRRLIFVLIKSIQTEPRRRDHTGHCRTKHFHALGPCCCSFSRY